MVERKLSGDPTVESQRQVIKNRELLLVISLFFQGIRNGTLKKPEQVLTLPKETSLQLEDIGNELLQQLAELPETYKNARLREKKRRELQRARSLFYDALLMSLSVGDELLGEAS
jgi:hypothetical protein